jgi:hypothetical protein
MFKMIVFASVSLLLTGCASVLNQDKQAIYVQTGCQGMSIPAQCVAENARGRWRFVTPAQVVVNRDMSSLRVTCHSPFVGSHTVQARAGLQPSMAGNLLVGGLVGAAVDVASARGLQYAAQIDLVFPSCQ